jgi:hypothetical protein
VLGGVVVEREQLVQVVGDLGNGLAELGVVGQLERDGSAAGAVAVLCTVALRRSVAPDVRRGRRPSIGALVAGIASGHHEHLWSRHPGHATVSRERDRRGT